MPTHSLFTIIDDSRTEGCLLQSPSPGLKVCIFDNSSPWDARWMYPAISSGLLCLFAVKLHLAGPALKRIALRKHSRVRIITFICSNCDIRIAVNIHQLPCLSFPILFGVLNNAECVNPEILNPKTTADDDSIAYCSWEFIKWKLA